MNRPTKLAASLACAAAMVITMAVLRPRSHDDRFAQAAPPDAPQKRVVSALPTPDFVPSKPQAPPASGEPIVVPPLPPGATSVPDADLLKLSAMVNLPNAEERHIDKEQWGRALPIAKQLAQGPCDCEQRNWLNHYIEMGEDALAGSNDAYYTLAALMNKMARNDRQLADDPGRIVR